MFYCPFCLDGFRTVFPLTAPNIESRKLSKWVSQQSDSRDPFLSLEKSSNLSFSPLSVIPSWVDQGTSTSRDDGPISTLHDIHWLTHPTFLSHLSCSSLGLSLALSESPGFAPGCLPVPSDILHLWYWWWQGIDPGIKLARGIVSGPEVLYLPVESWHLDWRTQAVICSRKTAIYLCERVSYKL